MTTRWEITKAVRASDLGSPSKLIMLVLADVAEAGTAEIPQQFTPSLTVLEHETGLGRSTIQTNLRRLESAGWIERFRPATQEAQWRGERVRYRLCLPGTVAQEVAQGISGDEPGVCQEMAGGVSGPEPLETDPYQIKEPSSSAKPQTADEPPRADVERVCRHLADKITDNGSRRPRITATWRDEARLLLDKDGRTVQQVINAIDWCQADPFWRANILSMPKLREKYDQLRLAAQRNGHARASPPSTAPEAVPEDQRCPEHHDQHVDACRHCRARRMAKPKGPR